MLIVVTGGAGSGKSEFAEGLVTAAGSGARCYLATMQVWDEECRRRVERHRKMRAGKEFTTVECPFDLAAAAEQVPQGSAVLLEDLTNLASNEWFGGAGAENMERCVLEGLERVCERAALTVVVANELFSDGIKYDAETARFLEAQGRLNRAVCARADQVYEVVCGIPVCWKGEKK
ncbi:MAG: bifunctional adenosylcobinamide kinase/adenosylcobinamide-phosphate guanylyltransferase [Oscillospiraceae bacterium]